VTKKEVIERLEIAINKLETVEGECNSWPGYVGDAIELALESACHALDMVRSSEGVE
jgi:hypothetical protein